MAHIGLTLIDLHGSKLHFGARVLGVMTSEIQKAKERAALALKDKSESQEKNRGYMVDQFNWPRSSDGAAVDTQEEPGQVH